MKKLIHSKTFWVAILQSVICIATAVQVSMPEVAFIGVLKSLADIWLRLYTSKPIKI